MCWKGDYIHMALYFLLIKRVVLILKIYIILKATTLKYSNNATKIKEMYNVMKMVI